jgi:peptidyl-tRNA hydrolase
MPKSVNDTQSKKNRTVVTKLENSVRKALALASSRTKDMHELDSFSYRVDWSNFPNSLMVNCHLTDQIQSENLTILEEKLIKIVQLSLLKQGIKFRDFRKNITLLMTP